MSQVKEVRLHRRAEMALSAFSPSERTKIERALSLLGDPTAADFVKANVYKLETADPTFLMRATPQIRILFNTTSGGIQVLDVVRRDKLRSFQELAAAAGPASLKRSKMAFGHTQIKRSAKRKRRAAEGR